MPLALKPKDLFPKSKILKDGGNWEDIFLPWLRDLCELLDEIPDESGLTEYNEELASHLGTLARYEYFARGDRDKALAEGYRLHPRGKHNSDEQVALARAHATDADRLHKFLKDLYNAIDRKLSTGQTNTNFIRDQMRNLQ